MNFMKRKTPSAKCPTCGKEIRIRPCGGDFLNDLYVIRHKNPSGQRCDGHYSRPITNSEIIEPKRP